MPNASYPPSPPLMLLLPHEQLATPLLLPPLPLLPQVSNLLFTMQQNVSPPHCVFSIKRAVCLTHDSLHSAGRAVGLHTGSSKWLTIFHLHQNPYHCHHHRYLFRRLHYTFRVPQVMFPPLPKRRSKLLRRLAGLLPKKSFL